MSSESELMPEQLEALLEPLRLGLIRARALRRRRKLVAFVARAAASTLAVAVVAAVVLAGQRARWDGRPSALAGDAGAYRAYACANQTAAWFPTWLAAPKC